MTYPTPRHLRRDLSRLIESEDLGEAFFLAAAQHTSDDRLRAQWEALYDLEVQTNRGVQRFLDRTEHDLAPTNAIATRLGNVAGAALHLLPHQAQLIGVKQGTRRYLPAFQRLAQHFRRSDDARFFDYVVAHELAIIEFADMANHRSGSAIDAVNRLLDTGVPG